MRKLPIVRPLLVLAALLVSTTGVSAQQGYGVPAQGATLETYWVPPEEVDEASTALREPHFVAIDRGVAPRGQLFVFLVGFAPTPADNTLIVRQAAASGFHAIGLSYPKPIVLLRLCEANPDESCFEQARLSVIDGGDHTPLITVAPADSIVNQLGKLLAYLAAQYSADGWAGYVEEGMPRWSAMRLAGHSEGGGHAALIARDQEVARLCLLEAPPDLIGAPGDDVRRVPPWVVPGGATPPDRIYGFRHVHTSSPNTQAFTESWSAFGLDRFGPPVDVDSSQPPYNGSHHLTTDAEPAVEDGTPNLIHRSLVEDRLTPTTASGESLFAPVWQYACMS